MVLNLLVENLSDGSTIPLGLGVVVVPVVPLLDGISDVISFEEVPFG